ncbi:NAD(P) transhydrogenase subunit alpha part 2 [Flindersiella endophytica]
MLLTIFVLSAFAGYEVISKVSTILHTPLMSGANAIHGVILVGAVLLAGRAETTAELVVGLVAVFLATLNMVGGFVVTDRMLDMFRVKRPAVASGPPGKSSRGSGAKPAAASPADEPAAASPSAAGDEPTRADRYSDDTPTHARDRWDSSLPEESDISKADRDD